MLGIGWGKMNSGKTMRSDSIQVQQCFYCGDDMITTLAEIGTLAAKDFELE